jgi:hypothetical protein
LVREEFEGGRKLVGDFWRSCEKTSVGEDFWGSCQKTLVGEDFKEICKKTSFSNLTMKA